MTRYEKREIIKSGACAGLGFYIGWVIGAVIKEAVSNKIDACDSKIGRIVNILKEK